MDQDQGLFSLLRYGHPGRYTPRIGQDDEHGHRGKQGFGKFKPAAGCGAAILGVAVKER